jgi:2-polyprenyl-3-methyl-5-hydroxy-6-metoxy-1,4-benzoquinol methylase
MVFVWPQPDEASLSTAYQMSAGYYRTAANDLLGTSPDAAMELYGLLQEVGVSGGRLLDLGCSTGKLIFHLQKFGYNVAGCDINADAINVARSNGLDAYLGTIEEINLEEGHFDVIIMSDVLEHLISPGRALLRAHFLLNKRGVLIIRIPNAGCGFARSTLFLSRMTWLPWAHSEAPYHLFDFCKKSIKEILNRKGFNVMSINFHGKSPFFYTIGGMGFLDLLKQKMKSSGHYKFSWKLFPHLPMISFLSAILLPFWVYGRMSDRIGKIGSSMVVIAQRKS